MSEDSSAIVERGVAALRKRFGTRFPKTAIVLGSGLGRFADALTDASRVPYADIPGFSPSTVAGHSGTLVVGRAGPTSVAVMQGRIHAYEGHPPQAIATPIRILRKLGVERLILTNAAGGLKPELAPGTLALIEDHINFSNLNPLVGPNDDGIGPRFPDMTNAYDPELRAQLAEAARRAGVELKSGVYVYAMGPSFETPAEIRMFARLGADLVGMSTVPECIAARHCGLKVAGISLVTNFAAGLSPNALSHAETLAAATNASERVKRLLLTFLSRS